jgi:hypothetical protein
VDYCRCNTQAIKTIGNAMRQCRALDIGVTIPANNRQKCDINPPPIARKWAIKPMRQQSKRANHRPTIKQYAAQKCGGIA